jgi:hypothetical protein
LLRCKVSLGGKDACFGGMHKAEVANYIHHPKSLSPAAVLDGSIAKIGTQYLLTLKAVNCESGRTLASTEAQASDENHVIEALGSVSVEIRNKLGESLSTIQKFDTPLEQATTPSLEARKLTAPAFKRPKQKGRTRRFRSSNGPSNSTRTLWWLTHTWASWQPALLGPASLLTTVQRHMNCATGPVIQRGIGLPPPTRKESPETSRRP